MKEDLCVRDFRAVFPDGRNKVGLFENDAFAGKELFHALYVFCREQTPVKSDRFAGSQLFMDKFRVGWHTLYTHTVKLNAAAVQFIFGLNEISAICPKAAFLLCYDKRPGRACKAGKIFARLPVQRRVLAQVRVGRRNDIRLYAGVFHICTQRCNSFWNVLHLYRLLFLY